MKNEGSKGFYKGKGRFKKKAEAKLNRRFPLFMHQSKTHREIRAIQIDNITCIIK
jgi:hypothetical protein